MIPAIPAALNNGFKLTSLLGDLVLDSSFKYAEARGARRQTVSRDDGQNYFTYLGDQMNDVNEFPLHLQGIINHQTAQEHIDYLIILYTIAKVCTSIVRSDNKVILTDTNASVKGFVTRTPVANSDKISQIDLYICVGEGSFNNQDTAPTLFSTVYGTATRQLDGSLAFDFSGELASVPLISGKAVAALVFITQRFTGAALGLDLPSEPVKVYFDEVEPTNFTQIMYSSSRTKVLSVLSFVLVTNSKLEIRPPGSVADTSLDDQFDVFIALVNGALGYSPGAFNGYEIHWPLKQAGEQNRSFQSAFGGLEPFGQRDFYFSISNNGPTTQLNQSTNLTGVQNGTGVAYRSDGTGQQASQQLVESSMGAYVNAGDEVIFFKITFSGN